MIDDRLRSAARDVRVEADRQVPPVLRADRHRGATVAACGLIVAALVAGVVLYSIRQGDPSPVVDGPVASGDTGVPRGVATPGSSSEIEEVTATELSDFIGTYEIDYRDANFTLGKVGTSELNAEMTSRSFCLRFAGIDGSCSTSADGSTLPTRPESLKTFYFPSDPTAARPLISLDFVAPDGVDLRLLDGDQPVCELQRFPLSDFGSAVVWACQARGPTDGWQLVATKNGRTLAAPAFAIKPHSVPPPTTEVPTSTVSTASLGIEQPLIESGITTVPDVAKPGSVHAFSVQGHPDLVIWTTVSPNLVTGEVEEWQCVAEANGSACGSTSISAQSSQTSSIDNNVASDDLFTWSNLPAEVVTVGYDAGDVKLWQHPVAGLAIFRVDPNHPHPAITAYDASGAALPFSYWGDNPQQTPVNETTADIVTTPPQTPVTIGEIWSELRTLTQSSIRSCLTTGGATWAVANVPTFNAGVDPVAIWNSCVGEVKSTVEARQSQLNKGT